MVRLKNLHMCVCVSLMCTNQKLFMIFRYPILEQQEIAGRSVRAFRVLQCIPVPHCSPLCSRQRDEPGGAHQLRDRFMHRSVEDQQGHRHQR